MQAKRSGASRLKGQDWGTLRCVRHAVLAVFDNMDTAVSWVGIGYGGEVVGKYPPEEGNAPPSIMDLIW
jgi:hypothetical protein